MLVRWRDDKKCGDMIVVKDFIAQCDPNSEDNFCNLCDYIDGKYAWYGKCDDVCGCDECFEYSSQSEFLL